MSLDIQRRAFSMSTAVKRYGKSQRKMAKKVDHKVKSVPKQLHNLRESLSIAEHARATAVDLMTEYVVYNDPQLRIQWVNRAAAESADLPPERLVGRHCYEVWHMRKTPCVDCPLVKARKTGRPHEAVIPSPDGRAWLVRGYPDKDAAGRVVGLMEVSGEVTEQRQTIEALKRSGEKYRSLFETTHEAIGTSGPDGRILNANPAMARLLGVKTPEDLIGLSAVELYADSVDRKALFAELKKNGYVENFELTLIKQDGSGDHIHILGNATLHTGERGRTLRAEFIFSDITERKKAVEFLKESEERYRSLTENINVGIYRNTPGAKGRFVEANPAIVRMFGYRSKEEFVAVSVSQLYKDPGGRKMFNEKMLENGYVKNEEILLKKKDGTAFLGSVTAVAVYDEKGKVKYYDGVIEDITERKRAEKALLESEEKFRLVADQSPNMIFINRKGRIIYVNKQCEQLLGYRKEEFYSPEFNFLGLIAPEFHDRVKASHARHARGVDVPPYEYTLMTKKGNRIDIILASKLIDYGGERAILGTVTDISERKRAEAEVRQSLEKMENLLEGIVNTMSITVETRDQYTAGHQRRVAALARAIAEEMGLTEERSKSVYMAALIHDIGKIAIPAEILSKPTGLSDVEFSIIETHPQVGYDILKGIDFPWPIAEIVLRHHERMDGSGYPQGLKEKEIPLEAKILSVADVVEAMASHRPYRAALGIGKALEEITQNRGRLYDEEVVKTCLKIFYDRKFDFEEE